MRQQVGRRFEKMDNYEQMMIERLWCMEAAERLDYMQRLADLAIAQIEARDREASVRTGLERKPPQPQTRAPLSPLDICEFRLAPAAI